MTLRALSSADLPAIDRLNPPDWAPFRPVFEHYFSTTCAQPYGLEPEGRLEAMGTLIRFGASAWISQLITHPDARGRGLGTTVLKSLLDEGRRRGVETFSLVATEEGFPLYDRAGFRVEGWYDFWSRDEAAPVLRGGSGLHRPLEPGDLPAVRVLDRVVSGADRWDYWGTLTAGGRAAEGPEGVEGVWLPRFGEGLVLARTETAGRALLGARLDGARRCVVPRENTGAPEVLAGRGFRLTHSARRMVLGPGLVRRPELSWSRVGGNLG